MPSTRDGAILNDTRLCVRCRDSRAITGRFLLIFTQGPLREIRPGAGARPPDSPRTAHGICPSGHPSPPPAPIFFWGEYSFGDRGSHDTFWASFARFNQSPNNMVGCCATPTRNLHDHSTDGASLCAWPQLCGAQPALEPISTPARRSKCLRAVSTPTNLPRGCIEAAIRDKLIFTLLFLLRLRVTCCLHKSTQHLQELVFSIYIDIPAPSTRRRWRAKARVDVNDSSS